MPIFKDRRALVTKIKLWEPMVFTTEEIGGSSKKRPKNPKSPRHPPPTQLNTKTLIL